MIGVRIGEKISTKGELWVTAARDRRKLRLSNGKKAPNSDIVNRRQTVWPRRYDNRKSCDDN
jgi:hypothetical protein